MADNNKEKIHIGKFLDEIREICSDPEVYQKFEDIFFRYVAQEIENLKQEK